MKAAFESRELEASFCRDFSCCGLVLSDLHDLLQHYEECHVRLEDDEGSFYDDDSSFWSPSSGSSVDGSVQNSPNLDDDFANHSADALKKKAAAYLSDLYNSSCTTTLSPLSLNTAAAVSTASAPLSPVSVKDESGESSDDTAATTSPASGSVFTATGSNSKKANGKKRSYAQYSSTPSALDLLTQSAAKKLALASNGELPTPILTDEDFLAQAGALLASANTSKLSSCVNLTTAVRTHKNLILI